MILWGEIRCWPLWEVKGLMLQNLKKTENNSTETHFNLYLDELNHEILSNYEGKRELPFSRC